MTVNRFCYVEKKDIEVNLKANVEENERCEGCMYLSFCKDDVSMGEEKTVKEKTVKEDKVVKEKATKEKVVKEKVVKKKTTKKKTTKKKKSLEELAEEDIF